MESLWTWRVPRRWNRAGGTVARVMLCRGRPRERRVAQGLKRVCCFGGSNPPGKCPISQARLPQMPQLR